ncbi:Uncharacterised protein [Corynebacterium renale]|nr:hypothetical protein [Corynebacterium renale]SQG64078.1 Uncharacterised protein [Corynebacterium renale]
MMCESFTKRGGIKVWHYGTVISNLSRKFRKELVDGIPNVFWA